MSCLETSFRTIRSRFFLSSFSLACSSPLLVSAAKPTVNGRFTSLLLTVARISGFLTSFRVIESVSSVFLILIGDTFSTLKSATAAVPTIISVLVTKSSTACNIWTALFTSILLTPFGVGFTGPAIKVTSAPKALAASAM